MAYQRLYIGVACGRIVTIMCTGSKLKPSVVQRGGLGTTGLLGCLVTISSCALARKAGTP